MFESVYWKKPPKGEPNIWDPDLFPGLKRVRWNTAIQAAILLQARTDAIELGKNNHRYFFPDQVNEVTPAQMEAIREELIEWTCDRMFALCCEDVGYKPDEVRDRIWDCL